MKHRTLWIALLIGLALAGATLTNCAGFFRARATNTSTSQDGDRSLARDVILRTDQVLEQASDVVRNRRNYTGKLANAYNNQQFAYDLFGDAEYQSAIEHSLYARKLAEDAISDNNGRRVGRDYEDERRIRPRGDGQLDEDLRRRRPNFSQKDEDVLKLKLRFRF